MRSPVAFQTQAVSAGMRLPSSPGVYLLPQEAQGWWSGRRGLVGLMRLRIWTIQSWVTCSRNSTQSLSSTCSHEVMMHHRLLSSLSVFLYLCFLVSFRSVLGCVV